MTQNKKTFSPEERKILLSDFKKLAQICYPDASLLKPSFKFLLQKDFTPHDGLQYGPLANGYYIPPEELHTLWQSRQELRDNYIDFITANGQKWFFNTREKVGKFFSEDGQKKVEVSFNFWMDAEKVWKVNGTRKAMQKILQLCTKNTFPTEKQAQNYFNEDLCRKVYEKNPSDEAVSQTVLEMIEHLRKALVNLLVTEESANISRSKSFKIFVKQNALQKKTISEQVQTYLKKNKSAVYIFGEQFGYIKNATRLIRYQELRDHVRHPDEVPEIKIKPFEIYEDFRIALKLKKKDPLTASHLALFDENTNVVWHIKDMSEILNIISRYEDKTLKKKNPTYWQVLVDKGIILPEDIPLLQKRIQNYNTVAHGNPGSDILKEKVADDVQIMDLNASITEAHQKIIHDILQRS